MLPLVLALVAATGCAGSIAESYTKDERHIREAENFKSEGKVVVQTCGEEVGSHEAAEKSLLTTLGNEMTDRLCGRHDSYKLVSYELVERKIIDCYRDSDSSAFRCCGLLASDPRLLKCVRK